MEKTKVFDNTGKKIVIYSDNGVYRLTAIRRAIRDVVNGVTRYYGSQWYIETHQRSGKGFVPVRFSNLSYVFRKKKDIVNILSKSIQFRQAYEELKSQL